MTKRWQTEGVISARFNRAWNRLVPAFSRHQQAPRDPNDLSELAEARWNLEQARNETRAARIELGQRRPPVSEPPRKVAVSEEDQAKIRVHGLGGP